MTFEEFLIKKKIDAIQLEAKEQIFYSEFKSHFLQMGEKSFDHSKKFWFNKLRRAYHLKEEPKPVKAEDKIVEIPASAQDKPGTEAINEGKPAYVPRFKAAAPQKTDQSTQNIESDPPTAYVPRFKAAIKMPGYVEDTSLNKEPESEEKPPEITTESIPQSNEQAKPAYKPRFKPGLTKKDPDSE